MTGRVGSLAEAINLVGKAAQFERDGRTVGVAERFASTFDREFASAVQQGRNAGQRTVSSCGERDAIIDIGAPCGFADLCAADLRQADGSRRIVGRRLQSFPRRNIRLATGNARGETGLARDVGVDTKAEAGHQKSLRMVSTVSFAIWMMRAEAS